MSLRHRKEFGDFQTPVALAREVCELVARMGIHPTSIVEPTCGCGNFIIAALECFPSATNFVGVDVSDEHVGRARDALGKVVGNRSVSIFAEDFFTTDWDSELEKLPEPLLFLGNPPWVTNSALASINSKNLPPKSNFQNHRGIDAITGKANFDIAEWMLIHVMRLLDGKSGALAMLCKTSTARKALKFCWEDGWRIDNASICLIDAKAHFDATVDGCLLIASFGQSAASNECRVYDSLKASVPVSSFGLRHGRLIADLAAYDRWRHFFGQCDLKWRSGIKHDCRRVMELRFSEGRFVNGLGDIVEIEDSHRFPMYKGSQISRGNPSAPTRWMVVPQRAVSEDTTGLSEAAPKTWRYLLDNSDLLDRRGSVIYKKRSRFSIFGVGDYTFSDWKVVVPALYKRPRFSPIGPFQGKPVVFDDTCYFAPCDSRAQAECVASVLNSEIALDALSSCVFWDSKRPITTEVLNRLKLPAIAAELDWKEEEIVMLKHTAEPQRQFSHF